jgi:hypothetical protein
VRRVVGSQLSAGVGTVRGHDCLRCDG